MLFDTIIKAIKRKTYRPLKQFNIGWLQEKKIKFSTEKKKVKQLPFINEVQINYRDGFPLLHALKEIFVEATYKFITDNPQPYIIDCGGYIGLSALYFTFEHPDAKIVVFEPDSENYALAKKNTEKYRNNIELINKAVWINDDVVCFKDSNTMGSAIVEGKDDLSDNIIEIQAARLKNLLNKKVDFLKIDIEGAEYEVMKDIRGQLHFVERLFLEYHGNYSENQKLTELLTMLSEEGYKWYIKEAAVNFAHPYIDKKSRYIFDMQLNIFAFR